MLSNMVKTAKGLSIDGGFDVWLHVYDLGPVSKWVLNSWSTIGAFHCGVEICGVEVSFQGVSGCGDDTCGLTWHVPKKHPRHVYRESLCMGCSPLGGKALGLLLGHLEEAWLAHTYDVLSRNCSDFAACLCEGLRTLVPFPSWVHGLAKALPGHAPVLKGLSFLPIACSANLSWCVECCNLCNCESRCGRVPPDAHEFENPVDLCQGPGLLLEEVRSGFAERDRP